MPARATALLLTLALFLASSVPSDGTIRAVSPLEAVDDPEIPRTLAQFTDLAADAWYAPSAAFLYRREVMVGTSPCDYSPGLTMSRAMLVTALYRCAGCPQVPDPHTFADVPQDAWYALPAAWAWERGLTPEADSTGFGPDAPVTLSACAQALACLSGAGGGSDPMPWAQRLGLLTGLPDNPDAPLTRAEAAVVLERFWRAWKGS